MSQPLKTDAKTELQDVPLRIGDQTYTLRFSLKAIMALKGAWKLEKDAEVQARIASSDLADMITVLWACFRTHHPEVTQDMVLAILDDAGATGLEAILTEVITAASPPKPKAQAKK